MKYFAILGSAILAVAVAKPAAAGYYELTADNSNGGDYGTGQGTGYSYVGHHFSSSADSTVNVWNNANEGTRTENRGNGWYAWSKSWVWRRNAPWDAPPPTWIKQAYSYTGSLEAYCSGPQQAGDDPHAIAQVTFGASFVSPNGGQPFIMTKRPGDAPEKRNLANTPVDAYQAVTPLTGTVGSSASGSAASYGECNTVGTDAGAYAYSGSNSISTTTFDITTVGPPP